MGWLDKPLSQRMRHGNAFCVSVLFVCGGARSFQYLTFDSFDLETGFLVSNIGMSRPCLYVKIIGSRPRDQKDQMMVTRPRYTPSLAVGL